MANLNPNPTEDFDLDLNPAPSQATSGPSGRAKLATAIAFIFIAGTIFGYALPLLARSAGGQLVPETTTTRWGQYGNPFSAYPDKTYLPDYPSASKHTLSKSEEVVYMTFPLDGRPADFTSASAMFHYTSINFTWVEVALVPGTWTNTTLTWNNRPLPNETIARVPIEETDILENPFAGRDFRVNVTRWVREESNLSLCLSVPFNDTSFDLYLWSTAPVIEWTHLVPVPLEFVPVALVAAAGGAAAAGIYLAKRKRGDGGK